MDSDSLVTCSIWCSVFFKGEDHVFQLRESDTLERVFSEIETHWPAFDCDTYVVQYKAAHMEDESWITLKKDQDVESMVAVHGLAKQHIAKLRAIQPPSSSSQRRDDQGMTSTSQALVVHNSNNNESWSRCIRRVGQAFKDANDCRVHLKNYHIAVNRKFKYMKNDTDKIIATCPDENCNWRFYASYCRRDGEFAIRKLNVDHVCGLETVTNKRSHPNADSNWVACVMKAHIMANPKYKPKDIVSYIRNEHNVEISYHTAWLGKEIALHEIHGSDVGSYNRLHWYVDAVRHSNPGSICDLETKQPDNRFNRLFMALNACLVGFLRGCRKIVFLDGTHIKSKFKGHLLCATAKDGNNQLFTIAYAVVDSENDENWEWFCQKLRHALESQPVLCDFRQYTFFSDRHLGLVTHVPRVFPGCQHAFCLKHLVDNFRTQVLRKHYPKLNKKHWTNVFNAAAYAPTRAEYSLHINKILKVMPLAADFLNNSAPENWANSLFTGNQFGIINNNIAECWNSWVKDARSLPIIALIDRIRQQIMTMMCNRREQSHEWKTHLCMDVEVMVKAEFEVGRSLDVVRANSVTFEVNEGEFRHTVDLGKWECSCNYWQILKLPCKHACACIDKKGWSVYDFCDDAYSVETYKKAYENIIVPVPNADMVSNVEVQIMPPDVRPQPGRPKRNRFPSQVVKAVTVCSSCKRPRHNKRTCRGPVSN